MSAAQNQAVFLSYASQDAAAARTICDALRAAGVEVWFDQSELRGGDSWDQKIRKQIRECALFVPIISANTQARLEGYFRLEWKLAAQRTHTMADAKPFLLPLVIDATVEGDAHVPEEFRAVQWTRLPIQGGPGGGVSGAFCARVNALLTGGNRRVFTGYPTSQSSAKESSPLPAQRRWQWMAAACVVAVALIAVGFWQPWRKQLPASAKSEAPITEARKLTLQARALIDDDWLAGRENFRLAEELCQRAVTLAPEDGEAWSTAARVSTEMMRRRYDITSARQTLARAQAERAIRLAPTSVEAGLAMAAHLGEARAWAEAESRLRDLKARAPQDPRVLLMLARVLNTFAIGKDAEATEIRLQHPVFAGRDPRPLVDEANARQIKGRFAEAEALVERAHALAPTLEGYYKKLLLLTQYLRNKDATREFIEQLPTQVLLEDAFASRVAQFYLRLGDSAKVLAHLRRVPREFFEEKQQVLPKGFYAGWAQQLAGRRTAAHAEWKQALSVVEKRIVAEPNQPELLEWKSLLLALTGQKDEAEKCWKLFGELMGRREGQEGFRYALFYVALGRPDDANRAIRNILTDRRTSRGVDNASSLLYDPWFEPIRKDPAMQQLVANEEAWLRQLWQPTETGTPPGATSSADQPASPGKSIAVLAFENVGGDKANEYFSDGISEELLNVLAKIPALKVTARTSAFHFKGKDTPIPEIAKQLGVAYVVEGSVRKAGTQVRISARLINGADGVQVWAEDFRDELKDVFALQDKIAGLIAKNLSLKLGASAPATPVDPEVFRLYLEGRQEWNKRNEAAYAKAQAAFERALALDPQFARARAALADIWYLRARGSAANVKFAADRANAEIERALALDPNLAEAYVTRAMLARQRGDPDGGEPDFRRALALNPNDATAHQRHGFALARSGKLPDGLVELEIAMRLDPLAPIIPTIYGGVLILARRWSESLSAYERALALQPDSSRAQLGRAQPMLYLNRQAEAREIARFWAMRAGARDDYSSTTAITVLALAGDRAAAEKLAEPIFIHPPEVNVGRILALYLALNRVDDAFAFLARVDPQTIDDGAEFTRPVFDPVRNDPRFLRKLEEAGRLAEYREAWSHVAATAKLTKQP